MTNCKQVRSTASQLQCLHPTQGKLLAALVGGLMAASASGGTIDLVQGWNLLGNSETNGIDVATRLNDVNTVITVWKWNKALSKWAFYTPNMTAGDLALYAKNKDYDVLTSIDSKEGYWVNAKKMASLTDPLPASPGIPAVVLLESDLALGWNLSASADNKTPQGLNAGLSTSLALAGKSIATQWAWDAGASRWKFFAPSLAAKGGTVLSDYITSKSYAAFDTAIGLQEGFWLNLSSVAGGSGGTTPPPGLLTDTGIASNQCYGAGSDVLISCTSAEALALNDKQDGMVGRDVTNPANADGKLGLSYSAVPNPAGGNFDLTYCVKDNITGLTWEGKTVIGTHADTADYTNYVSSGNSGTGYDIFFDAGTYVTSINAFALCGYTDWRLPTVDELISLVDYSVADPGPMIDTIWFPNTSQSQYWSATPSASPIFGGFGAFAWTVDFKSGYVKEGFGSTGYKVRLVR